MEERMVIVELLNGLMQEGEGDTFALDPVKEFVETLPLIPFRIKVPFVGQKKSGKDVKGYSPGIGNVSVPDAPEKSPREDPNSNPDYRFGMWDVMYTPVGAFIDHMWSHHLQSQKFGQLRARITFERDENGVIISAILMKWNKNGNGWHAWKYSDNLTEARASELFETESFTDKASLAVIAILVPSMMIAGFFLVRFVFHYLQHFVSSL